MSVLEFISSLKWPIVVLLVLGYGSRTAKKHPGLANWIASYVEKRDVRGKMGPAEFEAITPATSAIVQAAVASDDELASIALDQTPKEDGTPKPVTDVSVLRKEVIEDILRSSARWGYEMAQLGMLSPPEPYIEWGSEGRPEILFGMGSRGPEARTLPGTAGASQHVRLSEEVRRHFEVEEL